MGGKSGATLPFSGQTRRVCTHFRDNSQERNVRNHIGSVPTTCGTGGVRTRGLSYEVEVSVVMMWNMTSYLDVGMAERRVVSVT